MPILKSFRSRTSFRPIRFASNADDKGWQTIVFSDDDAPIVGRWPAFCKSMSRQTTGDTTWPEDANKVLLCFTGPRVRHRIFHFSSFTKWGKKNHFGRKTKPRTNHVASLTRGGKKQFTRGGKQNQRWQAQAAPGVSVRGCHLTIRCRESWWLWNCQMTGQRCSLSYLVSLCDRVRHVGSTRVGRCSELSAHAMIMLAVLAPFASSSIHLHPCPTGAIVVLFQGYS